MSKYGVFPGPYFPAFGLNISPYSVRMRENTDQEKFCIWTLFTQWEYSIPYEEIDSIMPQWEWEYSIPYEEIDSIMPQWVELRLWFMVVCEFCMLNKQILHIISLYGLNTTFNSIYTPYMGKSWPSKILYLWLLHAVLTTVLGVRIVLFSFRFLSVLFCCFLFIV